MSLNEKDDPGYPEKEITRLEAIMEETARMLDNLQWAKDFMERYERKHKIVKTMGGR